MVGFAAPNWKIHQIHASLNGPHCLVVADLDGDQDLDAATCTTGDRLAVWFENNGRGTFDTHIIGENQAAYSIRVLDMNQYADPDLLIAGQESKKGVRSESPIKSN